jgi:hypothetical protein
VTKLFIALAIGVVLFAAQSSSAQTDTRIKFGKGQSSTIVNGVTGMDGASYVIRLKGGQKMILNLTPATGAGIKVEADRMYGHVVLATGKKGGNYIAYTDEPGDCTIFIGATKHRSIPFTLAVTVVKMKGDI